MILVFTLQAESDLKRLGDYIAQTSPARAITFIEDISRVCDSLGAFPERYPIVKRYARRAIRRAIHGNYLIFYQIRQSRVVILRVLHGAMDYEPLLPEE